MNRKLSALIIACLFYSLNSKSETIITGKVTGGNPAKIEYSVPINGVCFGGFYESTKTDSLGNFQIKINTDKPTFVSIIIPGQFSNKMVIEPGFKYKVAINLLDNANKFNVLSPNKKGQDLYNSLPNPSFISMEFRQFDNDTTTILLKTKIASLKEAELSQFKKQLVSKEITQTFYKLVEADRDCYYSAILSGVLLSKFNRNYIEQPADYPSDMDQLLNSVFIDCPLDKGELINSSFWFEYARNYITCKEYLNPDFKLQELKDIFKNGLINTHLIEESKKRLTEPNLEYYKAAYIYFTSLQKEYQKELITIFRQFEKEYPHSSYTKYLEPLITPIIEFHQKAEQPRTPQIKFVENYSKISSLKEAVAQFKGQKVFIDVWATWCSPCKDEFKYKDKLNALLKKKNIQIVYISIDKEEQDKQWKDMANFYNLEGYHIRANEKFETDLRRVYNNNGSVSTPWYILINENGEIIKEHATRPSEIDKLENEINNN
jgi:thiol-disulfide isomerase/thioredoxin